MFLLAPPSFPHYTSPGIAPSQVSSTSAHFWKEHPHGFYCSVFVTKWWSQVVEYERCGHKQAPGCHFSPVCLSVKYCNFEGACGSGSFAVVSFNEQFLWSLGLGLIRPCPHTASGKKKAIATHRACLWMCNPLEDSPGSRIQDLTWHSNLSLTFCRAFPGWSCWNLGHQRADGVMSILTRCAHLAHFCHILKVVFIPYHAGPLTPCLLGIRDSLAAGCATEYTPRHPPSSEPYKKRPLVCHVKSNSQSSTTLLSVYSINTSSRKCIAPKDNLPQCPPHQKKKTMVFILGRVKPLRPWYIENFYLSISQARSYMWQYEAARNSLRFKRFPV